MKKKSFIKVFSIVAVITTILLFNYGNKVYAEGENATNTTNTTQNQTQPATQEVVIKQLSSLNVNVDTSKALYTGKKIKKSINIYDGNKKLVEGTDYTVAYKNNKKTGKAKITITGKGNYQGTVKRYFIIVPKKVKIIDVYYAYNYKSAKVEWERDKLASGYVVYMSTKKDGEYKKVKKIKNNKTTEYTVNNLNRKKMYYFKVCSYKSVGDKDYYSTKMSKAKTKNKKIAKISLVSYSSGKNRNHNLKLCCKKIKGTVIKPGQSFNWFKVVGAASARKGYKKAMVFKGKNERALGYGGGVCQVSSTLYQAALATGCKIIERHEHSQPVSYCKKGKDATVTYGANNLIFKNTNKFSIKLVTYAEEGRTTCVVYRID